MERNSVAIKLWPVDSESRIRYEIETLFGRRFDVRRTDAAACIGSILASCNVELVNLLVRFTDDPEECSFEIIDISTAPRLGGLMYDSGDASDIHFFLSALRTELVRGGTFREYPHRMTVHRDGWFSFDCDDSNAKRLPRSLYPELGE